MPGLNNRQKNRNFNDKNGKINTLTIIKCENNERGDIYKFKIDS